MKKLYNQTDPTIMYVCVSIALKYSFHEKPIICVVKYIDFRPKIELILTLHWMNSITKLTQKYNVCRYVLVSPWMIAFRKKPIICVVSWVGKVIVQVSGIAYRLLQKEICSILLPRGLDSGWQFWLAARFSVVWKSN